MIIKKLNKKPRRRSPTLYQSEFVEGAITAYIAYYEVIYVVALCIYNSVV